MPILHRTTSVPAGATVQVRLAPTRQDRVRRKRTGQPAIQPVELPALIDTGSEITCLDPAVVARLGILPADWGFSNLPFVGGGLPSPIYEVELLVPHPTARPVQFLTIDDLEIVERDLSGTGVQVLIGRDVLAYCVLVYDGLAGTFTLSY